MFLSYGVGFRCHVNSSTIPGMVSTKNFALGDIRGGCSAETGG